jgi:hypothetical protein
MLTLTDEQKAILNTPTPPETLEKMSSPRDYICDVMSQVFGCWDWDVSNAPGTPDNGYVVTGKVVAGGVTFSGVSHGPTPQDAETLALARAVRPLGAVFRFPIGIIPREVQQPQRAPQAQQSAIAAAVNAEAAAQRAQPPALQQQVSAPPPNQIPAAVPFQEMADRGQAASNGYKDEKADPVFKGGKNAGKHWSEVDRGLLEWMMKQAQTDVAVGEGRMVPPADWDQEKIGKAQQYLRGNTARVKKISNFLTYGDARGPQAAPDADAGFMPQSSLGDDQIPFAP